MNHSIRIKRAGAGRLYFEIFGGSGDKLATSESFRTICRLESSLATLVEAAKLPDAVRLNRSVGRTSIGPAVGRRQVHFIGQLDNDAILALLAGAEAATLIDERPEEQRRTDLSGPLCDLAR